MSILPTKILSLRVFFFMLLAILAFSCKKKDNTGSEVNPPVIVTPPVTVANFSVSDSKILDPSGNEFIAKGINVNGPYWPWSRPTLPDVSLITDIWKFNSIRLNCWREFSSINNNNSDMDGIVKAFTDKKVVVMIEEHNFTGKYPTSAELTSLAAYWGTVAAKFKSNPYVWFNIMNEPGSGGVAPQNWMEQHEAVITAIRAQGAENPIVLDEHGYGQASGFSAADRSAVLTFGPMLTAKYKNLIFSLHMYDQWTYSDARLKSYLDAAAAKKLAVVIGEYGVGAGTDIANAVATSIFKNVIPAKIGRMGWAWDGVDIYRLTSGTSGGWGIDVTSGAKPGNLSFVGNLIWNDNHDGINLSGTEMVPPAVLASNLDFETGAKNGDGVSNNWINFGTATIDGTAVNISSGSYSVKVASGSAGGCGQVIYLAPGTTYKITGWGKHSVAATTASSLGIKSTSTNGGAETTLTSLNFTEQAGTVKTATFTTPAVITSMYLFIYKSDAASAFWCDNISIVKQ